ncbi:MAG TPA: DUF2306 domain-containing protein [Caulobacteraceae bacterium]|nr:DUF2306 domain-containing protein [Caulobacteraceae bacterium]
MTTVPLHAITLLAFVLHIAGGTVGLVSGTVALLASKGGRVHRTAGTVFFFSMLVMAALACYLAVVMPGQLVNLFIGTFAAYLVATGWMTVRRRGGGAGLAERIAFVVAIVLCAPFAILSFQLAAGLPPLFKSAVPLEGPVLIAIYSFTTVLAIALIGDARVVLGGGAAAAPRIARHLWRMCLGVTLAAGSAFTNGLPRLLPAPHDVPPAFFLPQFIPVGFLIFWMIRVRFTPWLGARPQALRAAS